MRNLFLLIALSYASQVMAVCTSPISRTNFSPNTVLTSTKLNADLNALYTQANELPGDCITAETVTSAKILNGTIVNADISASAAIDVSKTTFAVATLKHVLSSGTDGGTVTMGSWVTRPLNTEDDTDGIVTLTANQFTLEAGTYLVSGYSTSYGSYAAVKLRNISDSTDAILGTTTYGLDGDAQNSPLFINGSLVIASSKTFAIQHYSDTTVTTFGFGVAGSLSSEVYASLTITRIK